MLLKRLSNVGEITLCAVTVEGSHFDFFLFELDAERKSVCKIVLICSIRQKIWFCNNKIFIQPVFVSQNPLFTYTFFIRNQAKGLDLKISKIFKFFSSQGFLSNFLSYGDVRIIEKDSNAQTLEAIAQTCSVKKLFLNISENSEQNTCARQSGDLQLY